MLKKLKIHLPIPTSKFAKLLKAAMLVMIVVVVFYLSGAVVTKIINDRQTAAEKDYQNNIKQSEKLLEQKNYGEAEQLWKDYLAKPPPKDYRPNGNLQLAAVYMNGQKFSEAQQQFRAAESEATTEEQLYAARLGIAQSSEIIGDKNTAKEYYRKVLDYLRSSDRAYKEADIEVFQARFDRLNTSQ